MDLTKSERQPQDAMQRLREENIRLKALLHRHGIAWEEKSESVPSLPTQQLKPATGQLSASDKIALFRRLFRGRSDVYPLVGNLPRESQDILQRAETSGSPVFAISRGSNTGNARNGFFCRFPTR